MPPLKGEVARRAGGVRWYNPSVSASAEPGAVRKVCRCEPVTDVTGVAAPRLDGNSLVLRPRCLKIRGIATPACALVRNDRAFSNSPLSFYSLFSGSESSWARSRSEMMSLDTRKPLGVRYHRPSSPCAV